MKKLYLLIALVASPVFAQEEEQEVQIEIETGGGVEVELAAEASYSVVAYPDKSIFLFSDSAFVYCRVNEDGNPYCERVDVDRQRYLESLQRRLERQDAN